MVLRKRSRTGATREALFVLATMALACSTSEVTPAAVVEVVPLPSPSPAGSVALDDALQRRRSLRAFAAEPVSLDDESRLLWAAQGITGGGGRRTAPSAGALYPLELYVATSGGVFHYLPGTHALERLDLGDVRESLSNAALGQTEPRDAPLVVIVTGVVARTRAKYGDRAERFVALEAGHATQNLVLEATALGLGGVTIGSFEDDAVRSRLGLPSGTFPYYLVCIGHAPR